MTDDGIGIEVARALRKLDLGDDVVILERQVADLSLLALSEEASKLVIVDAVKSGNPPGAVVRFEATEPQSSLLKVPISHEFRLYDLVETARESGIPLCPVAVVGIEPADCRIGKGLSKPVAHALPLAVQEVVEELKGRRDGKK
jgi:hydrogenase maturation protease